jgi:hypothetical protein
MIQMLEKGVRGSGEGKGRAWGRESNTIRWM